MKKTNPNLVMLVEELKKASSIHKSRLWKRIAADLEKGTRQRRIVNLARLNRFTKENETIIVPGKVLGSGNLSHKLTVAAFSFSQSAMDEINKNGKAIPISDLIKQDPKGKKIRIIG